MSDWIGRTLFKSLRRTPSFLSLAGPLTVVTVILSWVLLEALGFALIYWSQFPDEFQLKTGGGASGIDGFWTVLYFSLETLTGLGFGDVLPTANWLRILSTFEALAGFALITASISSIVLIYPALARMRVLARRTEILVSAARNVNQEVVSGDAERMLGELALDVIRVRVDFIHFPVIYYFHADHRRSSLACALPNLAHFAELGSGPQTAERVRFASAMLSDALNDLARVLSKRFIHADSSDSTVIFRAYAEHHVSHTLRED